MASRKPTAPIEPDDAEIGADVSDYSQPDPAAASNAAPLAVGSSNRFFGWMRELGIQRQPGWIGGVASGIGFRLGIDPIIIRGIIVVIAVLGGPALLLYAAAWLLLPDTKGRIHAEELVRGRFSPALIGIGVMVLLSLLPLSQGFWYAGAAYWGDLSLGASFGRVLWTALLLTAIVFLIIWLARRANGSTSTLTPATTDDKPETIPTPAIPAEQLAELGSTLQGTLFTEAAPAPPSAPAPDAPADELQAWKEQQTLWKQQHAEWKAQRSVTELELRQQHALVAHERALAASAERAGRRRLAKLANPRINAATTWGVLGASIIAGGVSALVAGRNPDIGGHEATIALAAAAIVLGLSVIVAGALRHRSGVLSFFALVAIVAMLVSSAVPRDRTLLIGGIGWGVGGDARLAIPVGPLYLTVNEPGEGGVTDIWQGSGYTELNLAHDASVRVELSSSSGDISVYDRYGRSPSFVEDVDGLRRVGDEWRWSTVLGPNPEPDRLIRLWQGGGHLVVFDNNAVPAPAEEPVEGTQP